MGGHLRVAFASLLLAVASAATTMRGTPLDSVPAHRLLERHRIVSGPGEPVRLELLETAAKDPPRKVWPGTEVVMDGHPARHYKLGKILGAGNFGNVYELKAMRQGDSASGRWVPVTGKVIKQTHAADNIQAEDKMAEQFETWTAGVHDDPGRPHLAIMERSHLGSEVSAPVDGEVSATGPAAKAKYKWQVGPNAGNTDLKALLNMKSVKLGGSGTPSSSKSDLSGSTWGQWLNVARQVTREVALALKLLAKKGYAHSDIKPDNIMLEVKASPGAAAAAKAGHAVRGNVALTGVQVADFGLASPIKPHPPTSGVLKHRCPGGIAAKSAGTPIFMAPEIHDHSVVCAPTGSHDVWSLGLVVSPRYARHLSCPVLLLACGGAWFLLLALCLPAILPAP